MIGYSANSLPDKSLGILGIRKNFFFYLMESYDLWDISLVVKVTF